MLVTWRLILHSHRSTIGDQWAFVGTVRCLTMVSWFDHRTPSYELSICLYHVKIKIA